MTRVTYRRRADVAVVEGEVRGPYRPDKKKPREVIVVLGAKGHVEIATDLIIEREELAA